MAYVDIPDGPNCFKRVIVPDDDPRLAKPRMSFDQLAARRRSCGELKAQGLPCPDEEAAKAMRVRKRTVRWSVGVTSCAERCGGVLQTTLASLANAGFGSPVVFVDGRCEQMPGVVGRGERIGPYGNFLLALAELTIRGIRNPDGPADFVAVFQDDLLASRNLRQYLEKCDYPEHGYWNLITELDNEEPARKARGWFQTRLGRGAVGLVFSREVAIKLLSARHTWDRMHDPNRGWRLIDGGVWEALHHCVPPVEEWCHSPSLVQHVGDDSTIKVQTYPKAMTFRGEDFDCLSLLG
jgi:hypothetical protein